MGMDGGRKRIVFPVSITKKRGSGFEIIGKIGVNERS